MASPAAAVAAAAALATSASDAPPIMRLSTAVTARFSASSSSLISSRRSASLSCSESSSYFFISSCLRPENCDGNSAGKYLWMNEKMSTCPTGVSGMMRMMMNGTNVKMSSAVRRMVCTSRGRRVDPITARPKNRADAEMSPPSIFTPRAINSAPSRAFPADSAAVLEMRSPNTSGDRLPIPSSAMPRRDLRSGMSVASSVRSSSLMSSLAPRSTVDTNFRSDASIAPNSSTSSSTSSLRSGASSDGTSAASSSSCTMIRSISTCNARTAATRLAEATNSSDSRIVFASRTRPSESFP